MKNFIFSFLALLLLPAYMSGQAIKGKVVDVETKKVLEVIQSIK